MEKKHFYYPSVDSVTTIHAIRWNPDEKPKAVLQIIHGMVEFIDRYDDFARYMAKKGILVVGEDHLGHGKSVISKEYLGYFGKDGNSWIISDIHQLRLMIAEEYPDLPYVMLGHSMGSFLLRQYITEKDGRYAESLAGTIIMGTGWQSNAILRIGKTLAKLMDISKPGKKAPVLDAIAFGSYLKKIDNPKTAHDWLTRDEEVVKKYISEPLCSFHFSPNAYYNMFAGMQKAMDKERMKKLPNGMPILICSGAEDPVGNYGEGVRKAFIVYSENTKCDVDIKLYYDDRHEILNELDKKDVYSDMYEFVSKCVEGESNK